MRREGEMGDGVDGRWRGCAVSRPTRTPGTGVNNPPGSRETGCARSSAFRRSKIVKVMCGTALEMKRFPTPNVPALRHRIWARFVDPGGGILLAESTMLAHSSSVRIAADKKNPPWIISR